MPGTLLGWLKGLFGWLGTLLGGRGAIQIGKENQQMVSSTTGSNSPIVNARDFYINTPHAGDEESGPKVQLAKELFRSFANEALRRKSAKGMDAVWFIEWRRDAAAEILKILGETAKQEFRKLWKHDDENVALSVEDAKAGFQRCPEWLLAKAENLQAKELTAKYKYL